MWDKVSLIGSLLTNVTHCLELLFKDHFNTFFNIFYANIIVTFQLTYNTQRYLKYR